MTRSKSFLGSCIAVVALPWLAGCDGGFSRSIPIPKSVIQQSLNLMMPISSGDYVQQSEFPVEVIADHAEALLEEGEDRIGISLKVTVHLPDPPVEVPASPPAGPTVAAPRFGPPGAKARAAQAPGAANKTSETIGGNDPTGAPPNSVHGTVDVWVGVRYDPPSQSIYCHSPEIAVLSFEELPSRFGQPVRQIVKKILTEYFETNAVYKLEDESGSGKLATSLLKDVSVRSGTLYVTIGL